MSQQNSPDTPSVENEPGQRSGSGSDSLRQHLEGDARRKALPSARRPVARDKLRILVVDDNPAMRYALVRGLQAEGFATAEAADGTEGLRLAPAASALVLDIHLPDIDGIEVCRLLRAKPATAAIPIVHVSSVHMDKEALADSVKAGADAFLVGPVDPQTLAVLLSPCWKQPTGHNRRLLRPAFKCPRPGLMQTSGQASSDCGVPGDPA